MNASRKYAAAQAIRQLMIVETSRAPYNNIYRTGTRTLKIYSGRLAKEGFNFAALQDKITDLADLFDCDVKFNFTSGNKYGGPAFIVKL